MFRCCLVRQDNQQRLNTAGCWNLPQPLEGDVGSWRNIPEGAQEIMNEVLIIILSGRTKITDDDVCFLFIFDYQICVNSLQNVVHIRFLRADQRSSNRRTRCFRWSWKHRSARSGFSSSISGGDDGIVWARCLQRRRLTFMRGDRRWLLGVSQRKDLPLQRQVCCSQFGDFPLEVGTRIFQFPDVNFYRAPAVRALPSNELKQILENPVKHGSNSETGNVGWCIAVAAAEEIQGIVVWLICIHRSPVDTLCRVPDPFDYAHHPTMNRWADFVGQERQQRHQYLVYAWFSDYDLHLWIGLPLTTFRSRALPFTAAGHFSVIDNNPKNMVISSSNFLLKKESKLARISQSIHESELNNMI